jgi:DNA-binding transcriptional ArsR family regulator
VDEALQAIANRRRRGMLQLVWDRERTAGEIAAYSALSRPATSHHLRVLRQAGLVRVRSAGNHRYYQADLERIAELRRALEAFWGGRAA